MKRLCAIALLAMALLSPPPAHARAGDRSEIAGPQFAVRHGAPLGWSGSATVLIGRHDYMEDMPVAKGTLLGLEAGAGGAKLSVGHTVWYHLLGYYPYGMIFGTAVKATLVRTWGEPHEVAPRATYVGGEAEIGLFFFNVSLGYLVQVGGNAASPDGLISWSLGAGF